MIKKTVYIWIVIVLLAVVVLGETYSLFLTSTPLLEYGINIVTIVIYSVLIHKLFKLTTDSIKWTKIAFIWTAVVMLYGVTGEISKSTDSFGVTLMTNALFWGIFAVIWYTFIKHLKKVRGSQVSI